jgi:hypothetical protein
MSGRRLRVAGGARRALGATLAAVGALSVGAFSGTARAQGAAQPGDTFDQAAWVDQFLDPMYVGPRFSSRAEAHDVDIFEAQVAPHLFFFQMVDDLLRAHAGLTGWGTGWTTEFVPLFRLRMTAASSAPVRTPTFNPQITVQKHFTWGAVRDAAAGDTWTWPTGGKGWVKLLDVQYTFAHHSNGQDGCTFQDTGTDPDCPPVDFSQGEPPVNTHSGNYGTNYETLATNLKWFSLGDDLREVQAHEVGLSWERYEGTIVARWFPGGFDDSQDSLDFQRIFGKHRVTGHYEYERALPGSPFERLRARAEATWISSAENASWQYRGLVDVAALFRGAGGFGLFLRLFYGQDYYNIRLEDVGFMSIVGLTWDTRALQVFRPARPAIASGSTPPPPIPPAPSSPPPPAPSPPAPPSPAAAPPSTSAAP